MEGKINAILMLEILGRPAEHVKDTLNDIVKKLGEERDVLIIEKKIAEPKKVENKEVKGELFSSFAEVEIKTNLQTLMMIIYGYMPSHIEIIEPENVTMRNSEMNLFFNELMRRLHQYDELAKGVMIERQILAQQIKDGRIQVEIKKPDKKEENKIKTAKKDRKKKKK